MFGNRAWVTRTDAWEEQEDTSPRRKTCNCVMRKSLKQPANRPVLRARRDYGTTKVKFQTAMFPLLQEPVTKEEFERELVSLAPKEAESRREFWTLTEALQAMDDTRCPPPDWFIAAFNEVLEYPPQERAQPWRSLRHRLLEHMGGFQKEPRATRNRLRRRY